MLITRCLETQIVITDMFIAISDIIEEDVIEQSLLDIFEVV